MSRSAGVLKQQDKQKIDNNDKFILQKNKFMEAMKPRLIQDIKGENTIVLTNLNEHYEKFNLIYSENSLFFKIKDVKEKNAFVFEVHEHSLLKTVQKPIYHKTYVLKYGDDKGLALLFLLTALATEKNKQKLFNEMTSFAEKKEVVYRHDLWADFTEINDCLSYIGNRKKYFYFHMNLRLILRKARKEMVVDGMTEEQSVSLLRVLKKYQRAIQVNFVKDLNFFERLRKTPDGQKINFSKKNKKLNVKNKNLYLSYPLSVPNKTVNTGFSFLALGLKMKEPPIVV